MYKCLYVIFILCLFFVPAGAQDRKKPVQATKADTISIKATPVMGATKSTTKSGVTINENHTAIGKTAKFISLKTEWGNMVVKLYDSTPLHSNNFRKLVEQGFYDSLLFHRVIPNFMIQGGDPNSKNALAGSKLGDGGDDMERIPAEFISSYFHKRGALAAARDGNPEKKSSSCQFYLVHGRLFTDEEMNTIELKSGIKFSAEQRNTYKTIGGSPHLDQGYTVFGEVVEGLDVIGKIAAQPRDSNNRPLQDLRMQMDVIENYTLK